jgi:hypothetical protein
VPSYRDSQPFGTAISKTKATCRGKLAVKFPKDSALSGLLIVIINKQAHPCAMLE